MGTGGDRGILISVLGSPRIERDGAVVTFDTRKAIALIAYLAVTGRPQRRETLAALLWPDADETRARSALRRTLSVVKQGLGEAALSVTPRRAGPPRWRRRRDRRARASRSASARRTSRRWPPPRRRWRGDLLAGLHPARQRGVRRLAAWGGGEPTAARWAPPPPASSTPAVRPVGVDEAIVHARRWLELDPLHEPAHRALMRLHAERGDRAAAVHQYRACVRTMDEELGVAPLEETTALYEAIAAGGVRQGVRSHRADGARAARAPCVRGSLRRGGRPRLCDPSRGDRRRGGRARGGQDALGGGGARDERPAAAHGALLRQRRRRAVWTARGAAPPGGRRSRRGRAPGGAAPARAPPRRLGSCPSSPPPTGSRHPSDGPGAEARFLDSIARAVTAAGSGPAGVIVVDDAQWADHASQQVLAHLVHRARDDGPVPRRHAPHRRGGRRRTARPRPRRSGARWRRGRDPTRATRSRGGGGADRERRSTPAPPRR